MASSLFCLGGNMLEKNFQHKLIKKIKDMFPGAIVLKTDPTYIQGLPDLLILYKKKWVALEVKKSSRAHHQPNQDYYIQTMNKMSFAWFISPENEEEVLNEIQQALEPRRRTCISRS